MLAQNTKNKMALLGGLLVISVVAGVMTHSALNQANSTQEIKDTQATSATLAPPIYVKDLWGTTIQVKNESAAASLVNLPITFPSKIPSGYNLKVSTADPTVPYMVLLYSQKPITDTMTTNDFFAQKGILVHYSKTLPNINLDTWIPEYINFFKGNAHEITINGLRGVALNQHDGLDPQGIKRHVISEVVFFAGNLTIELRGDIPETELIEIAQSIKTQ